MNPVFVSLALLLGSLFGLTAQSAPLRCGGGGEGPKPLSDISSLLPYKVRPVDTPATLQEFFVWENKNYLVYRDVSGDVRGLNLNKGPTSGPKEYSISAIQQPLSRIVDSQERYLTAQGDRVWVYDTWTSSWSNVAQKKALEPLFWSENNKRTVLVSHAVTKSGANEIHEFYSSQPGSLSQHPVCTFTQNSAYPMRAARGAADPYFYFYSEQEVDGRRMLTLQPLNVFTCRFEKGVIYEGIRHPVEDVIFFQSLNAIAVKLDHDEENLLWWSPQGCDYFNVKRVNPIVPNYKLPILMVWSPEQNIQMIYPERAEMVELLKGLPVQDLQEKDVWLSKDAKRLFLASKFQNDNQRWVMEMDIGHRKSQSLVARRDHR